MIAAHLVVGAAVGRTQVDVFEAPIAQAKGDPNESASVRGRARSGPAGKFYLDGAVVKLRVLQHRVRFSIRDGTVLHDPDGPLPLVVNRLQFDAMRSQLID